MAEANNVTKESTKQLIAAKFHLTDDAAVEAEFQRQLAAIDPNSPEYSDLIRFAEQATESVEERNLLVLTLRNSQPGDTAPQINPNADESDVGMNPFGQQGSNQMPAPKTRRSMEYSKPMLSNEAQDTIDRLLSSDNVARMKEVMKTTAIERLLIMKPNPSTYLKGPDGEPVKIVIDVKPEKLDQYRKSLDTSRAGNEAVFNNLLQCIQNKTPVPVFINDEGNRRVVGCIISNTTTGERRTLTLSTLKAFLMSETAGAIIGRPGVKISQWVSKDTKNTAVARSASMSIKWFGRDSAIAEGKVDFVMERCDKSKALSLGFDSEFDPDARIRIDDIFYVKAQSRRTNKTVVQGKRLTGHWDNMPRFVVKDEYANLFGQTNRSDKLVVTDAEFNTLIDQLSVGMSAIAAYEYQPGPEIARDSKFGTIVAQLRSASRNAPKVDDGI